MYRLLKSVIVEQLPLLTDLCISRKLIRQIFTGLRQLFVTIEYRFPNNTHYLRPAHRFEQHDI